ncbi:MAG: UvrD-helicase domain-containing protein [Candidatus Riflebacteria bacterium]|nr:UvrD-helicase domain-containing protein [Candidatus Riflebacteria bacterium]
MRRTTTKSDKAAKDTPPAREPEGKGLLKGLNPEQLAVAGWAGGPVVVSAGAGTGKTAAVAATVVALVDKGIHPSSILLLTFTRKAAREMLRRASSILDARCNQVAGGTFHIHRDRQNGMNHPRVR